MSAEREAHGPLVEENQTIEVGDFCLLDMAKYAGNWPQVARVTDVDGDKITIEWFDGSKNSQFKPFYLVKKGVKGRFIWTEEVQKSVIFHHGFQLTGSGLLPQKILRILDSYESDF